MLESEILQKMQGASIEERIAIIELSLQSLKSELIQNRASQPASRDRSHRPTFGFMKDTGTIHGDITSPAVPESNWEVLQ
jgi:hypothetical protein